LGKFSFSVKTGIIF